ncbi:hypothetical protein A4U98_02570 [Bifidobacterium animalis subsp. animalis]|nr:hypothetical protein A4U98_02570 [Bifidobacterium animalis subsp. animalis]PHQ54073.1 DNA-binding response regulator [Bifidobacterium animalis subsp. animalis]
MRHLGLFGAVRDLGLVALRCSYRIKGRKGPALQSPNHNETNDARTPERILRLIFIENDPLALKLFMQLFHLQTHSMRIEHVISSGIAALQNLEIYDRFDAVVMDMHLGDIEGPSVAWQIRRVNDTTPIIGVTSLPLTHYLSAAQQAGMQDLQAKKDITDIITSIQRIRTGRIPDGFESPENAFRRLQLQRDAPMPLTRTQTMIMNYIAQGYTDQQIAEHMHCTRETARKHRQNCLKRLGANNTVEGVIQWQNINRFFKFD